jgi:hypothetical protein
MCVCCVFVSTGTAAAAARRRKKHTTKQGRTVVKARRLGLLHFAFLLFEGLMNVLSKPARRAEERAKTKKGSGLSFAERQPTVAHTQRAPS